MEFEQDSAGAMPDNTRVRAAMARYAANPTAEEADRLLMVMMKEKFVVLVPMSTEPDGERSFVTVVDGEPHPILHVFTTMEEMPEFDEEVGVCAIPFVDLILDLINAEQRWNGLIVDPEAEHSITEYFPLTGGHTLHSTAALRKAAAQVDPQNN